MELNCTSLHPPVDTTSLACDACNMRPEQAWALGSCAICQQNTLANNTSEFKFFKGRRLGDIRQTSTLPKVLPDDYPPLLAPCSNWCRQFPTNLYGASWQYATTNCAGQDE